MDIVQELVGRKVTVLSEQGDAERQDVGTLEAYDGKWFRLRKSEREVLYFNTIKVRLLKPFES